VVTLFELDRDEKWFSRFSSCWRTQWTERFD